MYNENVLLVTVEWLNVALIKTKDETDASVIALVLQFYIIAGLIWNGVLRFKWLKQSTTLKL